MLLIPEIQISDGQVVTRHSPDSPFTVHKISPMQALRQFESAGAEVIQIVDVDAATDEGKNNLSLITDLVGKSEADVQVGGGIRTLAQLTEWFEAGVARVVIGTVAITDPALVSEAAGRHPGGILVQLATRDGYVMINGWRTQTSYRPQDLIYDLQVAGIAGIIHLDIDRFEGDGSNSLALTEELSRNISLPIYSSGTIDTLDDIARLRYLPNINGAIISHALLSGDIELETAMRVANQKETSPQPESSTSVVNWGLYEGTCAYMAAYTLSQAGRTWNQSLRETIIADNPYLELLIPQFDLEIDTESLSPQEISRIYEGEIERSDVVVALLDNVEVESWIGYECGYARALGKYVYGICGTDNTGYDRSQHNRLIGMCDEVIYYSVSDDIAASQTQISHELSSRILANHPESVADSLSETHKSPRAISALLQE